MAFFMVFFRSCNLRAWIVYYNSNWIKQCYLKRFNLIILFFRWLCIFLEILTLGVFVGWMETFLYFSSINFHFQVKFQQHFLVFMDRHSVNNSTEKKNSIKSPRKTRKFPFRCVISFRKKLCNEVKKIKLWVNFIQGFILQSNAKWNEKSFLESFQDNVCNNLNFLEKSRIIYTVFFVSEWHVGF